MGTYDDYLAHRFAGGCNDLDCQWCFPPEPPPGTCPAWDLLKEITLRDYKRDCFTRNSKRGMSAD